MVRPAMSSPLLRVEALTVDFCQAGQIQRAVDGISFSLERGQTLGIVGESGSGKSVTCLALLQLLLPPARISRGQAWFQPEGEAIDLLRCSPRQMQQIRGRQISMVFQEPMSSLNPVYSIGFQLAEAIDPQQRLPWASVQQRAIALLEQVQLLKPEDPLEVKKRFLKRYPHQLSGGQIQRVMIAMAMAASPLLLIADEPTTALDVTVQAAILRLLQELQQQYNLSLIFVTHDLNLVGELADRVIVMYQGQIVEAGTVEEVFRHPQHPYTKGLLACRPRLDCRLTLLPTVADFLGATPPRLEVISPAQQQERLADLATQPPLVRVEHLWVKYPVAGRQRFVTAVRDVSFTIRTGETLGLVGESGCGKTTLGRTLLRLLEPAQGKIFFGDRDISHLSPRQLRPLRQRMQLIFQDPYSSLNPRMTIGELVAEPLRLHRPHQSKRQHQERVSYLLERVGIDPQAQHRYPHEFSGGQRQRICIARALALNPEFIVCDEAVSALDVSVQAQVLNLLKELQREFQLTYLFISHDLSVVKFMSDRLMVMYNGEIVEMGEAEAVYQQPQHDYTRRLIAAIPRGLSFWAA
ncbi:ABC transporter ATP-binding protein [uncultured Thermosynechococcus sp.]|uniref:ABC transporter ATP-binding protein n=1 Tax=uncultured Thermosynechococcus sp. TaxID=436945 RepID=UPI003414672E